MTFREISRSDTELWHAILAGEPTAWKELVVRYRTLVYATCTYLGLSQSEAGDAFQQTWLLLFQKRTQIRDPQRLSAWLVTTARREALRLKSRAGEESLHGAAMDFPDLESNPEQELLLVERQAVLETAIEQLDNPCRELVRAFFFAPIDLSYDDIARRLGYSPNTLGAKRQRCLARLRRILEKLGFLDERKSEKEPLL